MQKDILKNLNPAQKEAVLTTKGPVLILAGAGSGKTRALTHRLAYLVLEKKVSPHNILAVTFTNKAAEEMKKRVEKLLGSRIHLPWLGTFHSVCVRILRREIHQLGYKHNFIIYDDDDSRKAVKKAMEAMSLSIKQYNPGAIHHFISGAKSELLTPRQYASYAGDHFQRIVTDVYKEYENVLKSAQALDFDDLIFKTVELFQKFPRILSKYQLLFRYILIDEYQDTNHAQYMLVKLIARGHQNICVVGDDFQAIYGWRGANFQNILNFEKDFPKAKVIKMEQNYRSTGLILQGAQKLIEKNQLRSQKNLWTQNPQGIPATVYEATNEIDEAEFVGQEILAMRHTKLPWNDFAIFYRTNTQSRIYEEAFIQMNIPYRVIGALRFWERKEIKDILAYLKVLENPLDSVSLERIINVPSRGIGEVSIKLLRAGKTNEKIDAFLGLMKNLESYKKILSPSKLVEKVAQMSGYKTFVLDGSPEGESRWENIQELKRVAAGFENLSVFLEQATLVSEVDNYEPGAQAVNLMTLHCAKGLEFPVVFIARLEEGLLPHIRSMDDTSQLEEERRLCYVGMTRAKARLYLLYAKVRGEGGGLRYQERSRFIDDISEEFLEIL